MLPKGEVDCLLAWGAEDREELEGKDCYDCASVPVTGLCFGPSFLRPPAGWLLPLHSMPCLAYTLPACP